MKRVLLALLLAGAVAGFAYVLMLAGRQSPDGAASNRVIVPPGESSRTRVQEPVVPSPPQVPVRPEPESVTIPPPEALEAPPAAPPSELLQERGIALPIADLEPGDLVDTYDEARGGGERRHEAVDIMAPRGTPVLAVRSGTIAKLFTSDAGGLTIYQFDANEEHCFYYAHLDRYAEGLREGLLVKQGTVIAYVGSSGNADPSAPHLHFAVYELGPEKQWYTGNTPVNPFPLLVDALKRKNRKG